MGNGSVSLTPAGVGLGPVARVVAPAQEEKEKYHSRSAFGVSESLGLKQED